MAEQERHILTDKELTDKLTKGEDFTFHLQLEEGRPPGEVDAIVEQIHNIAKHTGAKVEIIKVPPKKPNVR